MSRGVRRWRGALAAWLALASPGPAGAAEILVAGAVSLRGPLGEIARGYERQHAGRRVQLTFGASSLLAAQIRAGAPVDVFVSADPRIVDALVDAGRVDADGRADVARNRLVVMARPDLTPLPRTAEALAGPGVRRIAMPDGAVPVGRYAREWLSARGLLERLLPRVVPTEHARATLAAVDAGHADVAVVYATDARLAHAAVPAFEVPAAEQPAIVYAAARLGGPASEGAAFLAWLGQPAARAVLARSGFGPP
jgi:molybdate transport system substrate-binding protein